MSQLNVNTIKNRTGQGGISLPLGANSAGVITATNFDGSLKALDGDVAVGGALTVTGNMTVEGTQTIINTSSLEVADKTVGIGSTSSPTDASANGAGIVVYGSTDKSLTWGTSGTKWTLTGGAFEAPELNITGVSTFNSSTTFKGADFDGGSLLREKVNVTAGKLSDNTDINVDNGMVHLFTTAETATSTPNITSSAGINTQMREGDCGYYYYNGSCCGIFCSINDRSCCCYRELGRGRSTCCWWCFWSRHIFIYNYKDRICYL